MSSVSSALRPSTSSEYSSQAGATPDHIVRNTSRITSWRWLVAGALIVALRVRFS
jgi:hypothetical protein